MSERTLERPLLLQPQQVAKQFGSQPGQFLSSQEGDAATPARSRRKACSNFDAPIKTQQSMPFQGANQRCSQP